MAEEGQFRLEHEPYCRPLHGEVELFEAAAPRQKNFAEAEESFLVVNKSNCPGHDGSHAQTVAEDRRQRLR
jgi:hypothetical protein